MFSRELSWQVIGTQQLHGGLYQSAEVAGADTAVTECEEEEPQGGKECLKERRKLSGVTTVFSIF